MSKIVAENLLEGSPSTEWDVVGIGSPGIQGFTTDISANVGETVSFKVSTAAAAYRLDVYRMGYYGGLGARQVERLRPIVALPQIQPAAVQDATTGLVDCGTWDVSAEWVVPPGATSGIYFAKLVREDGIPGESHVVFVVRDDDDPSDLLFQTSDTTWHAYNAYGDSCLYDNLPVTPRFATKVSYNRPFSTRSAEFGANWVFNSEYPMVRWLESNGYDVTYCAGRHRSTRRPPAAASDLPVGGSRRVLVRSTARSRRGGARCRCAPRLPERQRSVLEGALGGQHRRVGDTASHARLLQGAEGRIADRPDAGVDRPVAGRPVQSTV